MMPCTVIRKATWPIRSWIGHCTLNGTASDVAGLSLAGSHRPVGEYCKILKEDMEHERGEKRATEFYRKNRKAMDAGFESPGPIAKRNPSYLHSSTSSI